MNIHPSTAFVTDNHMVVSDKISMTTQASVALHNYLFTFNPNAERNKKNKATA